MIVCGVTFPLTRSVNEPIACSEPTNTDPGPSDGFLLLEQGGYLLLEQSGRLLLE